jgi:predicted nucleotidyltransferase
MKNVREKMTNFNEIQKQSHEIKNIAAKCGVDHIRVFGSVARGEALQESDIDFLVHFAKKGNLLDLVRLKSELEKLLQHHVDVVTEQGLHWYIRESVLKEARDF